MLGTIMRNGKIINVINVHSFHEDVPPDLNDDLPLPEEDESLVDLKYIYWGYLNCCPVLVSGKKAKKENWFTYWVDLCGSTLRFYKDNALTNNSALNPPPSAVQKGLIDEKQSKLAVFELGGSSVTITKDGQRFKSRTLRRFQGSKIFRRHLFTVKFSKTNSIYLFQASSQCTLLRWVSKIQECVDAIANDQISFLAEERLKLAKYMMLKQQKNKDEEQENDENGDSNDASDEESSKEVESEEEPKPPKHPRFKELKKQLHENQQLLWQLEQQIINFLGNKGEFSREEKVCTTKQHYLLIPGRMETFIPQGTKVTVFGQLPNRRWRCLVEMDDLIKTMNELVEELQKNENSETLKTGNNNKKTSNSGTKFFRRSTRKSSKVYNMSRISIILSDIKETLNNTPDYPLIGSMPISVLEFPKQELSLHIPRTPSPEDCISEPIEDQCLSPELKVPYSSHKRRSRSGSSRASDSANVVDSEACYNKVSVPQLDKQSKEYIASSNEHETNKSDAREPLSKDTNSYLIPLNTKGSIKTVGFVGSNISLATIPDDYLESDLTDSDDNLDDISSDTAKVFLRNPDDSGIVIRKKLRQKGLSIIVGSSSSEDESDENDHVFCENELTDKLNNNT